MTDPAVTTSLITPEVLIAGISAISAMAVAYISIKKNKVADKKTADAEKVVKNAKKLVSRQAKVFDFTSCAEDWFELLQDLDELFASTTVDRFLILRAWNGELTPIWTTAIFQYRHGPQEPISYVSFELDSDYVSRLVETMRAGYHYMIVKDAKDCAIKSVYEMEGVQHSYWCSIGKEQYTDGSASITYCSFASHEPIEMSDATKTKCRLIANTLSSISRSINKQNIG